MSQTKSVPTGFLSYTHFDDEHNRWRLTEFQKYLSAEVRIQTGEEFRIFQDRSDIEWGVIWHERIEKAISEVTLLIPVITPSFFKSQACREELEKFLRREKELNRNDLILPLYYVDTPLMNDAIRRANDLLAQAIASHQYADWRHLRFELFASPEIGRAIEKLALQIASALERTITLTAPAIDKRPDSFDQNRSRSSNASPRGLTEARKKNPSQNQAISLDRAPAISTKNFYRRPEREAESRLRSGDSDGTVADDLIRHGMRPDVARTMVDEISKHIKKK